MTLDCLCTCGVNQATMQLCSVVQQPKNHLPVCALTLREKEIRGCCQWQQKALECLSAVSQWQSAGCALQLHGREGRNSSCPHSPAEHTDPPALLGKLFCSSSRRSCTMVTLLQDSWVERGPSSPLGGRGHRGSKGSLCCHCLLLRQLAGQAERDTSPLLY